MERVIRNRPNRNMSFMIFISDRARSCRNYEFIIAHWECRGGMKTELFAMQC